MMHTFSRKKIPFNYWILILLLFFFLASALSENVAVFVCMVLSVQWKHLVETCSVEIYRNGTVKVFLLMIAQIAIR